MKYDQVAGTFPAAVTIGQLIDKQDSFEIVRDRIGEILKANFTEQETLATGAGEDPLLFTAKVFIERSNPFEEWLNDPDSADQVPIINIMYDTSSFDGAGGNNIDRQKTTGTFNIDCYGYAKAEDDGNPVGGHTPGDLAAILAVQRCVRLARNIIMAGQNAYLQLQGLVWKREIQAITMFQPAIDGRTIQQVVACRMAVSVVFNETAPQITGEPMDLVSYEVFRAETGELYVAGEI